MKNICSWENCKEIGEYKAPVERDNSRNFRYYCLEHIKIFKVANINSSLKLLKSYNFWISAFDGAAKRDFTQHDWTGRNVLLFGSEGYGLKKKTLDKSDFLFKININNNMESLNISNSVSIVCHFIDFQTKGGKKKT